MIGDFIRLRCDIWCEGECVISSKQWYRIMEVEPNGVASAIPVEQEQNFFNVRLFYLCAVKDNEFS